MENERSAMNMSSLVARTWQVWCQKVAMFVLLMGLAIAVFFVVAIFVSYVVAPHPDVSLKETWKGMGFAQKLAVFVLFRKRPDLTVCTSSR